MFNYRKLEENDVHYVELGFLDLASGERMFLEIGDNKIVIFNIAGELYAIGDICTHDDGPLGDGILDGFHIVCPRHGAEFDVRTGKAVQLPAVIDIPAYPLKKSDNQYLIGIPK